MEMRSCVPLLLSRTSRTKAVFFRTKEKNKDRAFMFCETEKGWLTMWSLQRKIIIIYSFWLIPRDDNASTTHSIPMFWGHARAVVDIEVQSSRSGDCSSLCHYQDELRQVTMNVMELK